MYKNQISNLLSDNLPGFVKTDYPVFHRFIDLFYKWLETDTNAVRLLLDYEYNVTSNNMVDGFIDAMLDEVAFDIRQDLTIPKSTLMLLIREFYLTRGSANSFDLFYRLLYNERASVSYPREQLFTTSNALYTNEFFIVATGDIINNIEAWNAIDISKTLDFVVTGLTSKNRAVIEEIVPFFHLDKPYLKIFLSDFRRDFIPNETIIVQSNDIQFNEIVLPVQEIKVDSGGEEYELGDKVFIKDYIIPGSVYIQTLSLYDITSVQITSAGLGYKVGDRVLTKPDITGSSFSATVEQVDLDGRIERVFVTTVGENYSSMPQFLVNTKTGSGAIFTCDFKTKQIKELKHLEPYVGNSTTVLVESKNGFGAQLSTTTKTIFKTSKTYKNDRGILGVNAVITDSYYYQQFSYNVKSRISAYISKVMIDDYLHPAGYVRFHTLQLHYSDYAENELPTLEYFDSFIDIQSKLIVKDITKITEIETVYIPNKDINLKLMPEYIFRPKLNIMETRNLEKFKFSTWFAYPMSHFSNMLIENVNDEVKMYETLSDKVLFDYNEQLVKYPLPVELLTEVKILTRVTPGIDPNLTYSRFTDVVSTFDIFKTFDLNQNKFSELFSFPISYFGDLNDSGQYTTLDSVNQFNMYTIQNSINSAIIKTVDEENLIILFDKYILNL